VLAVWGALYELGRLCLSVERGFSWSKSISEVFIQKCVRRTKKSLRLGFRQRSNTEISGPADSVPQHVPGMGSDPFWADAVQGAGAQVLLGGGAPRGRDLGPKIFETTVGHRGRGFIHEFFRMKPFGPDLGDSSGFRGTRRESSSRWPMIRVCESCQRVDRRSEGGKRIWRGGCCRHGEGGTEPYQWIAIRRAPHGGCGL